MCIYHFSFFLKGSVAILIIHVTCTDEASISFFSSYLKKKKKEKFVKSLISLKMKNLVLTK